MEDETLMASHVPRTLETKSKMFGLELTDVVLVLLNLSLTNLVFGPTPLKIPMVFGTSAALALLLFFVKRGKPDKYLQHLFEHLLAPTVRWANAPDDLYRAPAKGGRDG